MENNNVVDNVVSGKEPDYTNLQQLPEVEAEPLLDKNTVYDKIYGFAFPIFKARHKKESDKAYKNSADTKIYMEEAVNTFNSFAKENDIINNVFSLKAKYLDLFREIIKKEVPVEMLKSKYLAMNGEKDDSLLPHPDQVVETQEIVVDPETGEIKNKEPEPE